MSTSTKSNYRSRKRTKTFTGCWTCRARKIKCDEDRPSCRQCREKGVTCQGYGSRLQWMTPETCGKTGSRSDSSCESAITQSLRRHIPAEPPKSILALDQVEAILRHLDNLESSLRSPDSEAPCVLIQNFGVFSTRETPITNPNGPITELDPSVGLYLESNPLDGDGDQEMEEDSISNFFFDNFTPSLFSEAAAAWDLCDVYHGFKSPLASSTQPLEALTSDSQSPLSSSIQSFEVPVAVCEGPQLSHQGNRFHSSHDETLISDSKPNELYFPDYSEILRCLEPLVVPAQERFLMDYYTNRVVNIFCVIDNPKSPWKTIHLPRVLQSAGELSFGRNTTSIRNALRNALLSITSFYLSNDHRTASRIDEAQKWENFASKYRCDAIGLLKQAMETNLYGEARPKYKEFLATMLSMVTINVMSGDTNTCSMHLDGAEQLINHMTTRKIRFSRKAKALHRIYFYLRVIHESTAPRAFTGSASRFSSTLGSPREIDSSPSTLPQHLFHQQQQGSLAVPLESIHSPPLSGQEPIATEMAACEYIYGIPQDLLLLLKDAIDVIDKIEAESAETGGMCLSEPLATLCDKLETEILDWPLEERLAWCREANDEKSAEIIHHQTTAFYNALIIYFSQSVRKLGFRYLRQYVQTILDSIEAIELIKAETKILAAPLFWPAFIGATEAFEPSHQERFRQWYDQVTVYGIAAVRTGIQVLQEVWSQGPSSNGRSISSWKTITRSNGESLMLT